MKVLLVRERSIRVLLCVAFVLLCGDRMASCEEFSSLLPLPLPPSIEGAREGATDGGRLWVLSANSPRIFELKEDDVRRLPGKFRAAEGLAFDGTFLWVAEEKVRQIVAINPSNGERVRSIPLRAPLGKGFKSMEGMAWDGEHFWTAIEAGYSSTLNQVHPSNGAIIRSFYAECSPRGIAVREKKVFSLCYNGQGKPLTVEERTLGGSDHQFQDSRKIVGKIDDQRASGLVFKNDKLFYVNENGVAVGEVQYPSDLSGKSSCPDLGVVEDSGVNNKRYAILVSAHNADFDDTGGAEFWYDIVGQYRMLREAKFSHSNIHVLYGAGEDFNTKYCEFRAKSQFGVERITDLPATKAKVENVFATVAGVVDAQSFVYVWWIGHGVGLGSGGCDLKMSMRTGEFVSDAMFARLVSMLSPAQVVVSLMTCHSGGVLDDLVRIGSGREIALTAAKCEEVAFSAQKTCNGHEHAEFNYSETAAVREKNVCDDPVLSDDGDGVILISEILRFLRSNMRSSPLLGGGGAAISLAFPRHPN